MQLSCSFWYASATLHNSQRIKSCFFLSGFSFCTSNYEVEALYADLHPCRCKIKAVIINVAPLFIQEEFQAGISCMVTGSRLKWNNTLEFSPRRLITVKSWFRCLSDLRGCCCSSQTTSRNSFWCYQEMRRWGEPSDHRL